MIILTGNDAEARALEWRASQNNCVWLSYDDLHPPLDAVTHATYQNLALFAEETRFPDKKAAQMMVIDLKSLLGDTPTERHPLPKDAHPKLLHRTCDSVVFSSISRLYNQMLVEIGFREEIAQYVYPLAAEALTHVLCTLRDSNKKILMTAHETFIGNRVVPHLPKSLYSISSLCVRCDRGKMIVLKSGLPSVRENDELEGTINAF